MVLLVTSDNEKFQVDKQVAERSILIKNMLEGMSRFLLQHVTRLNSAFLLQMSVNLTRLYRYQT